MTDFCYYANTVILIWLNFYPKSDILFKIGFFYSNGSLAIAVGAFRNQMVFHKMDNISSLALHFYPQALFWSLRWNTMEMEESLPEDQRLFSKLDTSFDFYKFFVYPIACWFVWVALYFIINFVVSAKRIRERNYDNMYGYYSRIAWSRTLMNKCGEKLAPVVFVSILFGMFILCHCGSILCFYSFYFHTFAILFWLTWSIWNASCFYMDYFSKRYEASLQKLEEIEQ